jgi:glycosyltransferase involved in cell wall biosynthesis
MIQDNRISAAIHQPKISVICVTYNAATVLSQFLNSVAQYKTVSLELVVIDGGSTDNTTSILKQNNSLIDYWLSEPDQGIYDAMNKATQIAHGQWLVFFGADDLLLPGFSEVVKELHDTKGVYYGNVLFHGYEYIQYFNSYTFTKTNICHQGIFYPKAVFEKYKYDTNYIVLADYHLNLRCWKDQNFKFIHINYLVASHTKGGMSSYIVDHRFEQNRRKLFKENLGTYTYYRYLNRTTGWVNTLKSIILNQ